MCADAGIFIGNSEELQEALGRIRDYGSIPIVISPDQSVTYQMYLSYCNREQTVNLLSIDERPDLNEDIPFPGNSNWLSFVLSHAPNYLFNYALLGYQSYLSNTEMLKTLTDLHFDLHRLGQIRKTISSTEPLFRNADFVSFDIGAIRASDSDCNINLGPNGLYAEEACQLIRYAGISNKLSMLGIFGWINSPKLNSITPMLIAQLIWHFIDGVVSRSSDGVVGEGDAYTTYKLSSEDVHEDLVFYKNNFNSRWWMNVPINDHSKGRYRKHRIVPCAYEDYQQAMKGEIPDTWWQTYQKLM
jgi:arginase family enzyme